MSKWIYQPEWVRVWVWVRVWLRGWDGMGWVHMHVHILCTVWQASELETRPEWASERLTEWLTEWLGEWLTEWVTEWHTQWLTGWHSRQLSKCEYHTQAPAEWGVLGALFFDFHRRKCSWPESPTGSPPTLDNLRGRSGGSYGCESCFMA